jgi:hypothetical protein
MDRQRFRPEMMTNTHRVERAARDFGSRERSELLVPSMPSMFDPAQTRTRRYPMRILMMLVLTAMLAACQSSARRDDSQTNCGPGGMGCPQGPMPYGDIDGAVGGTSSH